MNSLTIIGNLTGDPQSRNTQDDKTVCNFTVAVNRRRTRQDQNPEADFFRVAAWGRLGESCQKFLAKGRKVCVTGPVSVRTYQAQDGTTRASMEVLAQDVEFLGGGQQSGTGESAPQPTEATLPDGELPF